jgi:hypothetical protein
MLEHSVGLAVKHANNVSKNGSRQGRKRRRLHDAHLL